MEPLPMAPSCTLDEAGLRTQVERYRRLGADAVIVERGPLRIVVELDPSVETQLLEETLSIERECCPFYALDWDAERRRLSISVAEPGHSPALEAIAFALGLDN